MLYTDRDNHCFYAAPHLRDVELTVVGALCANKVVPGILPAHRPGRSTVMHELLDPIGRSCCPSLAVAGSASTTATAIVAFLVGQQRLSWHSATTSSMPLQT